MLPPFLALISIYYTVKMPRWQGPAGIISSFLYNLLFFDIIGGRKTPQKQKEEIHLSFLYALEKIRTPFLDDVMQFITNFGGEAAFLAIALFLYWCVDKRHGYYVLMTGFFGTILNQFLKLACRIPRPWVQDPGFSIVESARAGATGYSFPSGHTQNAVGTFGCIAVSAKKTWLRAAAILLALLVPFSRMYLGVHTPLDVGVSFLIAIALIFLLRPVVYGKNKKAFPIALGIMSLLSAAFILYVELYPFPASIDPDNLASGTKNAYTLFGALIGILIVYTVDETKLHFPVRARWYAQLMKYVLGLVLVVGAKALLKAPLLALCGGHDIGNALRYFIIVLIAGVLWPLTFPWFSRLGKGKR